MPDQPRAERRTQNRVVALFTDTKRAGNLGHRHLGDGSKRPNTSCIETDILGDNLRARGYSPAHVSAAIRKLEVAADPTRTSLYHLHHFINELRNSSISSQRGRH